jgi:hypothetical protein
MKKALTAALLTLCLLLPALAQDFPSLEEILPTKSVMADVMKQAERPEWAEVLEDKMRLAVARNPEWMTAYKKQHKGVYPLPYNEYFDVTREEYERYTAMLKQKVSQKTGELPLIVKRAGDILEISFDERRLPNPVEGTPPQLAIQPIKIDLFTGEMTAPQGRVLSPQESTVGPNDGPIGPHQAYIWDTRAGQGKRRADSATVLAIGRMTEGNRHFLHYAVVKSVDGAKVLDKSVLLYFTPAAAPTAANAE